MNKVLAVIIVLVVIIAGVMIVNNDGVDSPVQNNQNTSVNTNTQPNNNPSATTTDPDFDGVTSTVKIALLDNAGTSGGKMRGCDRVVLVSRDVGETRAPLNAALEELFSLNATEVSGWQNFIARTNDTLKYDRVTVANGVASIYLTGSLSGLAGTCDDPRAKIQIEETALQFPSITGVVLFLNGEPTTLQPDQSGN